MSNPPLARQSPDVARCDVARPDRYHGATEQGGGQAAPPVKESPWTWPNSKKRAPKASRVHHFKTLTSYV